MEQSMFGAPLADVEDNLEAQFVKQNSSLDLGNMSARAGYSLAKGVGGLMGMEDPRIAEARKVQEVVQSIRQSGTDMSDPSAYYKKMAGAFGAAGLTKQAEAAAMKALEYSDKQEKRAFDREKMGHERSTWQTKASIEETQLAEAYVKLAAARAKAAGKVNGPEFMEELDKMAKTATPESKLGALNYFNKTGDLEGARKMVVSSSDDKVVGSALDGQYADYAVYLDTTTGQQYIKGPNQEKIPYSGKMKLGGGTTVSLNQETVDQKARAEDFSKSADEFRKRLKAAQDIQPSIKLMRGILDSGQLSTGSLADLQTAAKRLAGTFGGKWDVETLQNDDLFDAMVTNVVLPKMALLGGNDSEQELKVIRESTGSRKFSVATLGRILEVMEKAVAKTMKKNQEFRAYKANPKNSITAFDFDDNEAPAPVATPAKPATPANVTASNTPRVITPDAINKYIAHAKGLGKNVTPEQAKAFLESYYKGK